MIQRHKEDVDCDQCNDDVDSDEGYDDDDYDGGNDGRVMGDHVLWAKAQSDDSMFPTCAPSS